ncbi:MAG: benzoate-CoA ligase [Gammaproteobacteria bacterium]|jgi:benzoate-CoA ligase
MTEDSLTQFADGRFNFAAYLFERNIGNRARVAYIDDQASLTYGALEQGARQFANALLASGIRREERVLLLMHDCNDWPVSFLGCLYAGVIPVAVNTLLTADDYAYVLEHSRAQAAIVSAQLVPILQTAMAQVSRPQPPTTAPRQHEIRQVIVSEPADEFPDDAGVAYVGLQAFCAPHEALANAATTGPDDAAFWLYSSGSTGRPKGAVHTHANPYWTVRLYGTAVLGIKADDVCFSAAKLFFAYGLGNALSFPLSVGATVVLMAGRPTPDAVFKRWKEQRPTIFFGAPTGFAGMLASPDLPDREDVALRLASSAGEALPADLGERFTARFGVEIIDGIGSTEMLHIYLSNRPGDVRYGTTGRPVPGYEIALRGDDGGEVPAGEPGDLYVRGPSSALMYWGNREKSRETFQGVWTKSGDKFVRNDDGTFTYSGRSDDMLKVSGIYVSPFEVEATLAQHEAVLEAAVIGVADSDGLTKAKAFVVLKDGAQATDSELQAHVKDRLAPYKYPRTIEFLVELPKTATGKIQRFRLREREDQAPS